MKRNIQQVLESIRATDITIKKKTNLSKELLNIEIKAHLNKAKRQYK